MSALSSQPEIQLNERIILLAGLQLFIALVAAAQHVLGSKSTVAFEESYRVSLILTQASVFSSLTWVTVDIHTNSYQCKID